MVPSVVSTTNKGTGLKHGTDQETDRKTDHDKLQIQGLERNLDQICMWFKYTCIARLFHGQTTVDRGLQ